MNKKGFIGVFIMAVLLGLDALVAGLVMTDMKKHPVKKGDDHEMEVLSQ